MLRRLSEERGIALVMALGVLVALSISAIALIGYSGSTVRTARYGTSREAAYALGEAGVNEALSILSNTSNPTNSSLLSPTTVQLAGGSTTYSGVLSGAIWTLTGVGSIPNPTGPGSAPVTRTVTRVVSMSSVSVGSFSGLWDRIYSDATGTCSVTVNAGMNIPSKFAAKGDVCLNDSSITGSGTTVDVGGKVTITGSAGTTSGPRSPSAGTGWTNPTNVYTSNSVYATNVITAGATGATQDTTGFGFAIPTGATIGGITASIKRHASTGAVLITHDASSSKNASSVSSTSWSHTVANQTDRMLVVGVTAENSTSGCQPSGVTYSGQALTKITENVTSNSPYVCASEWYLSAPPVGTANVVVTFGGTIQYVTAGATSLYNVKQGAPDASNSSFSTTGMTSTSVTTVNPNSWVVDVFGSGQPGALTAGAGQTSRWTQTVGSQAAGGMSTEAVASPGSATMSWTQTGTGTTADVLADNPVSYWRLGETSGTTATDQKGVANGTYTGGYTLNQTGALSGDSDKAVLLNGTSGYVNVGNPASLQIGTGTLEAWIKTANAGTSWRDIVCKDGAWDLTLKGNVLDFYSYSPAADRLTTVNAADNAWHHVAVTFQSGVTNGTKVYFDGNLVLTTTAGVLNQTGNVQIGNCAAFNEYFSGTIDEVAIYNTVLSATQIQRHYAGDNRTAQVVAAFSPVASGIVDNNVVLLKGGAPAGSNYADTATIWGTSDATITYGTDLWGTTWTPAEVNASNFGLRLIAKNLGGPSTTGSLDYVSITVTYWASTPPGIGTPGTPVATANIAGTCKWAAQTAHTPCSATDNVWASTITTSPVNLSRPTINWQYWYDNAAPGPKHGCTTSTGTPPVFDSNTTYDGLNSEQELTPEGGAGASYTCQSKDANGNIIGELSWNDVTRVMIIKGTIFFDGNAVFHTHDYPAWHYHGRGVIYISHKWHNDEPVCAGSATTDCRATGMPAWDTNIDLMVLVIGGKNTPGADDFDFHRNNSAFQGAIYSVNTCKIRETAYMQGPLDCGVLDFDLNSPSFFAWPPLPNSATGQIYTTGTDSDVQLVIGAQSG